MTLLASYLEQLPASAADKRFVDKSIQLSGLLQEAMQRQGITQRALAERLGKKESEISRWLSGLHNFTLKTITRLEAVLDEDLVLAFRDTQNPPAMLPKQAGHRPMPHADRWTEASFQETSEYLTRAARQAQTAPASIPTYADAA
ncbi:MAG: XRE family transcriptional regulator [Hymenobacter sp.]|nr:MAG: XRE family transcriptional regulator [Hymenobacter sp.]